MQEVSVYRGLWKGNTVKKSKKLGKYFLVEMGIYNVVGGVLGIIGMKFAFE